MIFRRAVGTCINLERLRFLSYNRFDSNDHMQQTLQNFLSSFHFNGLGPRIAKRIVEQVGAPALVKLLEPYHIRGLTVCPLETIPEYAPEPSVSHLEPLSKITGVHSHKLETLNSGLNRLRHVAPFYSFKTVYGLSPHVVGLMRGKYNCEQKLLQKLVENPYFLCTDVKGIGFQKADQIAHVLGHAQKYPDHRLEAAVYYALKIETYSRGNVFAPWSVLLKQTQCFLRSRLKDGSFQHALESLEGNEKIVIEEGCDENHIYLRKLYDAELNCSEKIAELVSRKPIALSVNIEKLIEEYCQRERIQLTGQQRSAIAQVLENPFSVITGNPGVGKTFVLKAVADIWKMVHPTLNISHGVQMLSPTGRGASRIKELTGDKSASTIHRILMKKDGLHCDRFNNLTIPAGLIVIDEVSMVGIKLMSWLLKHVSQGSTIVVVGDPHQLPSVGPGNILADLLLVDNIPKTALTQIFRQEAASEILKLSACVRQGQVPIEILMEKNSMQQVVPGDTLYISQDDSPKECLPEVREKNARLFEKNIVHLYEKVLPSLILPQGKRVNPKTDVQFLSPMHKQFGGTQHVNKFLTQFLFPERKQDELFFPGDRVMQTINNYDLGVYNGDVGTVVNTVDFPAKEPKDSEKQKIPTTPFKIYKSVLVDFGTQTVDYSYEAQPELIASWAMSIHKSQGSEFPVVVVPLFIHHYMLLYNQCIYTALTRAKCLLVVIGSRKAIQTAVRTQNQQYRCSGLVPKLVKEISMREKRAGILQHVSN